MPEYKLPTIASILECKDVISAPDASATVVKLDENTAVKFGKTVILLEAENLDYVARNSDVPVPKVYGTLTEEGTGTNFIIMELVEGQTLEKAWPTLTASEKMDVVHQLRRIMSDLRRIPPLGYIGSIGRQPCEDGIFYPGRHPNPEISGPFDTEEDMNQGILRKLELTESASYVAFARSLFAATLHGHQVMFAHGDLQPKNIIVKKTDSTGEAASIKIKIIDWEISGWYPEYWDFCTATISSRWAPEWLDIVQEIMPPYPHEYFIMKYIRQIFFY